jgi:hypothetical protein
MIHIKKAESILGINVKYDEKLFDSLSLMEVDKSHYVANDIALETETLDVIIARSLQPLYDKDPSEEIMLEALHDVPHSQAIVNVMKRGPMIHMQQHFSKNQCKKIEMGQSYLDKWRICNHAIRELIDAKKVLVFSKDSLCKHDLLRSIHLSPLVWAEKSGKVLGRTCLNGSKGTKNQISINEGTDCVKLDELYPETPLPTLSDLCELACTQQSLYPNCTLNGATVDVASAYQQIPQSVESSKLFGSQIKIPDPDKAGKFIILIFLFLCGVFGYTRAGHIYCFCAMAVDLLHNKNLLFKRSVTYVDDGILIDSPDNIETSVNSYIHFTKLVFGPNAINKEKIKQYEHSLQAIGWHFDFNLWRVQPREKGIAKMMRALFITTRPGMRKLTLKDLEHLTGLLDWYSSGIPIGKCFLVSLYRLKSWTTSPHAEIIITEEAQRDLNWWRAIVFTSSTFPHILGARIDSIRKNKTPDIFIRGDASLRIGAGGYISDKLNGDPIVGTEEVLRWSKEEIKEFEERKVDINVLEYFVDIFIVLIHSNLLQNKIVFVESDNTSAVSWLLKSRAKGHMAADALTRIFTLFCLHENITIVSRHIKGIENILADKLSRDLSMFEQRESLSDSVDGDLFVQCSRKEFCRRLLYLSVVKPEKLHGVILLDILTHLQ